MIVRFDRSMIDLAKSLTQKSAPSNRRQHRTALETDSGRSALAGGTGLHAP
jgi:hypothetical protein